MTYEEYERRNEMEDNYQDAVEGIVENMSFDDHADDGTVDFGKLADAYEAMTEEEHAKLKEIAPAFYAEVEKMHEDYPDCSCAPAVKAWNEIWACRFAGTRDVYSKVGQHLPELKKALDDANNLVLEYMEEKAKEEPVNYQPDF